VVRDVCLETLDVNVETRASVSCSSKYTIEVIVILDRAGIGIGDKWQSGMFLNEVIVTCSIGVPSINHSQSLLT
jgi:hypothetical protein